MVEETQIEPDVKETLAQDLLDAVKNNDTSKINSLIEQYKFLLNYNYVHEGKTILLIACSNCDINAETVRTLLDLNANPRHCTKGDGWETIHWAARSTDYDTLNVLLERNPKIINASDNTDNNALHVLFRFGEKESSDFQKCIDLLLEKGIDVNHKNMKNMTPIDWAIKRKLKSDIIEAMKNQSEKCPDINTGMILLDFLKEENETKFVKFRNGEIDEWVDYEVEIHTLLQMCCEKGLTDAAIHLLNKGANHEKTSPKNNDKPIFISVKKGNKELFRFLLEKYSEITEIPGKVLPTIVKYIDREYHDNFGCYKVFIKKMTDQKITEPDKVSYILNELDEDGNTALHYAVVYAEPDVIKDLLSLGASLGTKNKEGIMPIKNIDVQILKNHLDKCVEYDLSKRKTDKEFTVKFNYRTLIPPNEAPDKQQLTSPVDTQNINDEAQQLLIQTVRSNLIETEVIFFMSKASEYKHLLNHPVIVSFLLMKWLRIQWLFWANLSFYLIFSVFLVSYIFTDYAYFSPHEKSTIHNLFVYISKIFLIITLIILILRELFQICVAPTKYVTNWENYLEIFLIIFTAIIVFVSLPAPDTIKQLSSVSILLAAFELVLMAGNHHSCSIYVEMLRRVMLNFFKLLRWYALLIVAFAASFYLLFASDTVETQIPGNNTEVSNSLDDKSFENIGTSIFKTIIMLTGEFDTSNINFDTFTSRIIFVLFIFMIAIILLNLLNGLAVNDIQMIEKDAELVGHIARAQYIRYVESILVGNPANLLKKLSDFCHCLSIPHNWTDRLERIFFSKYLENYELIFFPNKQGLVDPKSFTGKKDGLVHSDSFKGKKRTSCAPCCKIDLDCEVAPCCKIDLGCEVVRRTNTIIRAREDEKPNDLESLKSDMKLVLDFVKSTKDK